MTIEGASILTVKLLNLAVSVQVCTHNDRGIHLRTHISCALSAELLHTHFFSAFLLVGCTCKFRHSIAYGDCVFFTYALACFRCKRPRVRTTMCTKMIFTRHIRAKVTFGSVGSGQPCSPRWVDFRPIERVRIQWTRWIGIPILPIEHALMLCTSKTKSSQRQSKIIEK